MITNTPTDSADLLAADLLSSGLLSPDSLDNVVLFPQLSVNSYLSNRKHFSLRDTKQRPAKTLPALESGITELAVDGAFNEGISLSSQLIIDSLLNRLSRLEDHRWITLICHQRLPQDCWQHLDIDPSSIRTIYLTKPDDFLWVTWEALSKGNSRAVITQSDLLSHTERKHLINAAQMGDSHGFLLAHQG